MGIANPHAHTGHRARGEAYEEFIGSVYLAAVRLGLPTREGLRQSGLKDEEIDAAMEELAARDLLLPSPNGDAWEVMPPREAITRHAERIERRVAISRATAAELEAIWRRAVGARVPVGNPNFDLLYTVQDIVDRLVAVHRTATDRLWIGFDGSEASRLLLARALEDEELLRVREGVDVRLTFDTRLLEDTAAMAHLDRSVEAGHAIRVGNGVPFTLALADDQVAVIDLSSFDASGQGSIEVRGPGPLAAITKLLDEIWQLSTHFGPTLEVVQGAAGQQAPLDARDQRILHLLTTGVSDQVIARQVGVSVRTVERRVRYLMEHLGSATRFQAGVQAVRRGWV